MFDYHIAGMHFRSEINIQAAREWRGDESVPDVMVRIVCGEIEDGGFVPISPTMGVHPSGLVRIHVETIGSFFVLGGRYIGIAPRASAHEEDIECFLTGPALGALCAQREMVALNATCVFSQGRGIALMGRSGIGKTALAAGLNKQGYGLVSDDVSIFRLSEGKPTALPTIGAAKVWQDTFECLGIPYAGLSEARTSQRRYVLPFPNSDVSDPVPLAKIFILEPCASNSITRISALEGAWRMQRCLKTPKLVQIYGTAESVRDQLSGLADNVECYRVGRNLSDHLATSVSLLEKALCN